MTLGLIENRVRENSELRRELSDSPAPSLGFEPDLGLEPGLWLERGLKTERGLELLPSSANNPGREPANHVDEEKMLECGNEEM
jgi:hypothetical protein